MRNITVGTRVRVASTFVNPQLVGTVKEVRRQRADRYNVAGWYYHVRYANRQLSIWAHSSIINVVK